MLWQCSVTVNPCRVWCCVFSNSHWNWSHFCQEISELKIRRLSLMSSRLCSLQYSREAWSFTTAVLWALKAAESQVTLHIEQLMKCLLCLLLCREHIDCLIEADHLSHEWKFFADTPFTMAAVFKADVALVGLILFSVKCLLLLQLLNSVYTLSNVWALAMARNHELGRNLYSSQVLERLEEIVGSLQTFNGLLIDFFLWSELKPLETLFG